MPRDARHAVVAFAVMDFALNGKLPDTLEGASPLPGVSVDFSRGNFVLGAAMIQRPIRYMGKPHGVPENFLQVGL